MKELNCSQSYRDFMVKGCTRVEKENLWTDKEVIAHPEIASRYLREMYTIVHLLCEDCNTLEAEVARLREENETLKKQMEDDLK